MPNLRKPWANLEGATYEPLIIKFVSTLNELRAAIKTAPIGFTLTFEVEPEQK